MAGAGPMRMLLVLLLLLNAGLAAYYLAFGPAAPPHRPAPGPGSLILLDESDQGARAQSDGATGACWRSAPIPRGEPLQQLQAALHRAGFKRLRVSPAADEFAVLLARAGTIQEAAAELGRLREAGVDRPRVRPDGDGALLVVAGRFAARSEAGEHARRLRQRGFEASVLAPEAGTDAVRLLVRGSGHGAPPAGDWQPVDCQ